jgi:two-component system response regulator DegU
MNICKLGIADHHELFRKGFMSMFLNIHEFKFIIEAKDGSDLLHKLNGELPDIIFFDLDMPHVDEGFKTLDIVLLKYPSTKLIALSMYENDQLIIQILKIGVHGYLSKKTTFEEVKNAIYLIQRNGFYFTEFVTKLIHQHLTSKNDLKKLNMGYSNGIALSSREKEILQLISNDFSTSEIADKLFISVRTVEGHRLHLLKKTNTKTIAGAVAYALRNHLI